MAENCDVELKIMPVMGARVKVLRMTGADTEAEQEAFIKKCQAERLFGNVRVRGGIARLHVTQKYMALDFDTKSTLAAVVYAYAYDPVLEGATVLLIDSQSGKKVGEYGLGLTGVKLRME